MAQALCGPSNALQNLQKHASTDRTLQQGRLVSSQSSSQNFRSRIPLEDLAADAELAAFEAGLPAPVAPAFAGPTAFPHHRPAFAPQPLAHPAESSWASDFQQLNISGAPQASIQHTRSQPIPFRAAAPGNWHNEFLHQQHHFTPPSTQASQRLFGTVGAMNPMSRYSMYNSTATPSTNTAANTQTAENLDDAAFEAAFAEAKAEIDQLEQETVQHVQQQDVTKNLSQDSHAEPIEMHHQEVRIGADTIQETKGKETDRNDDLARTAGQLLDSVQHETSQKFKESNFLALMRQLRDREVVVEGDELRQVQQPLHPGGEFYPEGRRSFETVTADETSKAAEAQSLDSKLPPLPYGTGYETSYGNNYLESKSLGDSNVLYDGMAWEKGVLPDYLRVI